MTDEDIFEILRKQEEALSNKNSFYFHYDPSTARIINFRNYLEQDDTFPFIKINEEDLEFSIDELFDILDYRVVEKNKKLVIEKSKLEEISLISNIIYQVPKIYSQTNDINDEYDLLIEQDNEHKEFIIKISKKVKQDLVFFNMDNKIVKMFVTALDDPNILYKTLTFAFKDLYGQGFKIPFGDYNGDQSNIFLMRYFQNYLHLDIRND